MAVKLVPGCCVFVRDPTTNMATGPLGDVLVRDLRSKERHFLPHGTQALVLAVHPWTDVGYSADVTIFVANRGFFVTTTGKLKVLWSPVQKQTGRK